MHGTRLDRLLTVHLFYPYANTTAGQRTGRIPILMYHSIQDGVSSRTPYFETATSTSTFAQHMEFLSRTGYLPITLERAVAALEEPSGDRRPVVLTFDDGYRNFYTTAYPILRAYGFAATVFLIAGLTGDKRSQFCGSDCLTWSEVRELQANGVSIGSHTVTHPQLALLNRTEIDNEVGRSKLAIEAKLGVPVKSFSYPFAFPESNHSLVRFLATTLKKHGYEDGVSTCIGTARQGCNHFFLPRLPVNNWDDPRLFQAKLEGGYDWLSKPQSAFKRFKQVIAPHKQTQ